MNAISRPWIALAIGMLLIMSAILSGEALALQYEWLNGEIGLNKLVVAPVYAGGQHVKEPLEAESMERLRDKLSGHVVSFSASREAVAEFEGNTAQVMLHGVDASYIRFKPLSFVRGGYWSAYTDAEQGKVAVIDAGTALKLFGSYDVIGIPLEIAGDKYRVIGVAGQEASLTNKLFDDGGCHVYIPISAFIENSGEIGLDELQIAKGRDGSVDSSEISAALTYITDVPEEYNITDYSRKSRQLHQKSEFIVFVLGLLIEILLFKHGRKIILETAAAIKEKCRSEYLADILRNWNKRLLTALAALLSILCIAVFIGWCIRFELYIPSKLIPDELIDLAFWRRMAETRLQEGLESLSHYRTSVYIYYLRISRLQNLIFIGFIPLGFWLLNSWHSKIGINRGNIVRNAAKLGVVFVIDTTLWLMLSVLTGLPVCLDFNSLFILLSYIFIKISCLIEEDTKCSNV